MKRTLSILLVMLLSLSVFSFASAEERPTISYWANWCGSLPADSYCETVVQDALGIEIEIPNVSHSDSEAVNLMLSSGEMPDCGWFGGNISYAYMDDQELIRTIPISMIEEYAPSLAATLEKYPTIKAYGSNAEDPTQMNFIPSVFDIFGEVYTNSLFLRYDWIKNLGIDLGVEVEQLNDTLYIAKSGLSRETFEAVLDGFVNGDPDNNGQDDTVGMMMSWENVFAGSFDLVTDNVANEDGSVTMWYTHENTKDMLKYVSELYAKGLIQQELFTNVRENEWEYVNNGVCGVVTTTGPNCLDSWAIDRPPLSLWAANPEAEMLLAPFIANEEGEAVWFEKVIPTEGSNFFVNAEVDDEKLVTILKFFEFCNYGDGNINTLASLWYGEQGRNWEWIEGNDIPQRITPLDYNNGEQIFCRCMQINESFKWTYFEPLFVLGAEYYVKSEGGVWCDWLRTGYKFDLRSETEAAVISNEYSADWNSIRSAFFTDVITGVKSVDADWDAYIQSLNDAHYDEYLAELDKAMLVTDIKAMY